MATKHLGLLEAIEALLHTGTPVAGGHITVGRTRAISSEYDQAVNVRLDESRPVPTSPQGRTYWETLIEVECFAKSSTEGVTPQQAVDPLLQEVYERVLADHTLAGTAVDCNPTGVRWEPDEQGETACRATAMFLVLHQSVERSIST